MQIFKNIGTRFRRAPAAPPTDLQLAKEYIKEDKKWVDSLEKDKTVIKVTANHSNPKVAALGKAIDEMLQEPLAKRFLRYKIRVFIRPSTMPGVNLFDRLFLPKKILAGMQLEHFDNVPTAAVRIKTIQINGTEFKELSVAELKAFVGHEIGHLLALHGHFRRKEYSTSCNKNVEDLADEIGVFLSREPEGLKTGIDKACAILGENLENIIYIDTIIPPMERQTRRNNDQRKLNERNKKIDEISNKISTSEGRSAFEAELTSDLQAEHRKLFLHQHNREIPHTR